MRWSRVEVEAWQNQRLQSIINLAARKVPFYRQRWQAVDWQSIVSAKDLSILPTLDKHSIRENELAFLVEGCNPAPVRTVIVSGDTLMPRMRETIETFFQCKCVDQYGQTERIALAMECAQGKMHVVPGLGIWEILRDDGSPCPPGEVGEIVATGLLNDAMPLIRYRLGDYASWSTDQNCPCGNQQPIISNLEGRVDDYLITKDGCKIGRLSTAMKRSPTIHSAQIVQDKPGHAYLLIRPGEGYNRSDALAVCDDIVEKIGVFDLEIAEVSDIPRTPRGKTPLVVRLAERQDMAETFNRLFNEQSFIGKVA